MGLDGQADARLAAGADARLRTPPADSMPPSTTSLAAPPPRRIESALLLRRWEPADAPALFEALVASTAELRRWTPWVAPEPLLLDVAVQRVAEQRARFDEGGAWVYGVFERDGRVLGSVGLFERIGPGALEIGYWIRSDATGRGHARGAAALVRDAAFAECGAARVEIRCNPANAASNVIPERLGFRRRGEILLTDGLRPGESGHLIVWEQLAGHAQRA